MGTLSCDHSPPIYRHLVCGFCWVLMSITFEISIKTSNALENIEYDIQNRKLQRIDDHII